MLMLLFYVGKNLYALDTSQVVEVIPRVLLRKTHQMPDYVAGMFQYRSAIVPVIDLCHLIQGQPSCSYLSTRIIMVNYFGKDNAKRCIGLMAERVTETLNKPDSDLIDAGTQLNEAPAYLGEMIMDDKGMIQRIRLEYLLSDSQHQYLLAGKNNGRDNTSPN
ncbi:chemotaxis protein CheW [Kamptonema sp. UHCC 0994]|uniref:chemotaxis protein CheW n=1 Tax=Kamptonema sp. UHCC 0994 TaxID=3031329 RepID=UPI0023B957C6|nr:chemotaxis protein CheW [Kamptonema sp. UHCC 0994]MDF0553816.1 chemotaxis protein CheW [Kamptonema sp. UHCC 0994]